MAKYLFILGRDWQLSLLELESFYGQVFEHSSKKCIVISLDKKPDIKNFGGVVKIGLVGEVEYRGKSNTFYWGVSDYDETGEAEFLRKKLSKSFRAEKLKAIYKPNSKSPSVVKKYKLLDVIVCDGFIARTVSCYNAKEVIQREENKPEKDFMSSSSARLARIMINLSGAKRNQMLLDPFCGMGVVLQEALLKGLRVTGLEVNKETARKCKKNLYWLKRSNWEVINADSRQLSEYIVECDVIVSEPYMGPFLDKIPTEKQAWRVKRELEELYTEVFSEIKKVLKKGGRAVFVIPSFRTKEEKILNISFNHELKEISRTHFNVGKSKIVREVVIFENTN